MKQTLILVLSALIQVYGKEKGIEIFNDLTRYFS